MDLEDDGDCVDVVETWGGSWLEVVDLEGDGECVEVGPAAVAARLVV